MRKDPLKNKIFQDFEVDVCFDNSLSMNMSQLSRDFKLDHQSQNMSTTTTTATTTGLFGTWTNQPLVDREKMVGVEWRGEPFCALQVTNVRRGGLRDVFL